MPPSDPSSKKAGWPMPFRELISRRDRHQKSLKWHAIFFGAFFMIGNSTFPSGTWFRGGSLSPGQAQAAAISALVLLILAFIGIRFWDFYRTARKLDLYCPECRQPFVKEHLMAHTVASGKCARCNAEIITDHPSKREGELDSTASHETPAAH